MSKQIFSQPLGGDGGKVALGLDGGMLQLALQFPSAKILSFVKVQGIDRLKAKFPSPWVGGLLDGAYGALVGQFAEVVSAPMAMAAEPAPQAAPEMPA